MATEVPAQINFKIKLKYVQDNIGLLEMRGPAIIQFQCKIELRGYLSQRCGSGVILGVTLCSLFLRKRAPVLIWYHPRPEEVKSKFFHAVSSDKSLFCRPVKLIDGTAYLLSAPGSRRRATNRRRCSTAERHCEGWVRPVSAYLFFLSL